MAKFVLLWWQPVGLEVTVGRLKLGCRRKIPGSESHDLGLGILGGKPPIRESANSAPGKRDEPNQRR